MLMDALSTPPLAPEVDERLSDALEYIQEQTNIAEALRALMEDDVNGSTAQMCIDDGDWPSSNDTDPPRYPQ